MQEQRMPAVPICEREQLVAERGIGGVIGRAESRIGVRGDHHQFDRFALGHRKGVLQPTGVPARPLVAATRAQAFRDAGIAASGQVQGGKQDGPGSPAQVLGRAAGMHVGLAHEGLERILP
jgi:hypothetical protein